MQQFFANIPEFQRLQPAAGADSTVKNNNVVDEEDHTITLGR